MSNEWFFATSNERILQRVRSDFLQRATSATSNERILQRVTSDFTTSEFQQVTSNEWKLRLGTFMALNCRTAFHWY